MIAITLGVGSYRTMAEISAKIVQRLCGIEVYIAGDEDALRFNVCLPQFLKFYLFDMTDEDRVMFFDPDIVTLRSYDPAVFAGTAELVAVRDIPSDFAEKESGFLGFSPENYFNTGWFIVNRFHHQSLFEQCKRASRHLVALRCSGNHRKPIYGEKLYKFILYDQAILNHVVYRTSTPVRLLDWRYNFMLFGSGDLGSKVSNLISIHLISERKPLFFSLVEGGIEMEHIYEVSEPGFCENAGKWAHFYAGEWRCDVLLRPDGTIGNWHSLHFWFIDVKGMLMISHWATISLVMLKDQAGEWKTSDGLAVLKRL